MAKKNDVVTVTGATDDQLVKELARRHLAAVVITVSDAVDQQEMTLHYDGGVFAAAGAIRAALLSMEEDFRQAASR